MPVTPPPSLPGELALWLFDSADATALTCVRNHFSDNDHDDNLLTVPEQFYNPAAVGGGPAFYQQLGLTISEGFTDPFGGIKATRIQGTGVKLLQSQPTASALIPAGTYTLSGYFKSNNGVASNGWQFSFGAVNGDAGMTLNIPDTGVWQRFSYSFTVNGTQTNNRFVLYKPEADNCDFLMYGMKLNPGGSATDYVQPDFEMRLGLGTTRPTWTSEGITADSGDIGIAIGQTYPTFAEQSGYMCVRIDDASASRISVRDILSAPAASPGFTAGTINSQGTDRQGIVVASGILRLIAPIEDSKYHVIAWTWDGTTVRYYLDGTYMASVAASTGWTSAGFLLGDAASPFVGKRGPHAIYTEAHTDAEVREMTDWIASEMAARSVTVNDLQTLIAFEGDSITAVAGAWVSYSYTFRALQGLSPVQHGVTNAVPGSTLFTGENMTSSARTTPLDAMLTPNKAYPILSVHIGTNDLGTSGATAQQTFDRLKAYCQARKAAGWNRIIVWTLTPYDIVDYEAKRLSYNTLIRNASAEGWYDYCADVGADPELGDPTTFFATYADDGVHPNEAGHDVYVDYAIPALEAVLAMDPVPPPASNVAIIGGGFGPFYGDG